MALVGLDKSIHICGVYMVLLAEKSPDIRSYTVYIYTVLANLTYNLYAQTCKSQIHVDEPLHICGVKMGLRWAMQVPTVPSP